MKSLERFEDICLAMSDPSFYPHAVSRLERRDTHISAVFLTGEWVYKLKKPVDFGFLDFTKLEARHYFCRREVSLNQRLSEGVYEGVVEIRKGDSGRLSLGGNGEVVEYAVKMRQLPDDAVLKELLKAGGIGTTEMELLGRHLAAFYERSSRSPEIDHYGHPEVIRINMEENFQQVEPFVDDLVPRERWEFIRQASRAFFQYQQSLFDRRIQVGRIRDCHGDLRAEHIYFFEGIQIIDCIEFNERFRYGDVIADLAFLQMDLEHLGHSGLSRAMLAAYVQRANDLELYSLIDFYATYRAVVKVKVACLRSTEVDDAESRLALKEEAFRYLEQAYCYAVQFSRPTLWVFSGLPATGKSALARLLADSLSLPLFQSDKLRRGGEGSLPDQPRIVPYDQGIYRGEMRQLVYGHMLALAHDQLRNGRSVILDASFSRRKWRDQVRQLATDLDTNVIFLECVSRGEVIRERLREREEKCNVSDARLLHLPDMIRNFEPLSELKPEIYIKIETDCAPTDSLATVFSEGYARKCAQVARIL